MSAGKVTTVLGEIDAGELGVTYCHEHLFAQPGPELMKKLGDDDVVLASQERSEEEVRLFQQAGGEAIVDCGCTEYGRNTLKMAALSRNTGCNVIASTGHIMEGYWRGVEDIENRSDESLLDEMLGDLTEGTEENPAAKAGVIKVGTSLDRVHPDEERMLRLAADSQARTGAPIQTHTSAGTIPLEQVRIFKEAGADPEHTMIGHLDRRLDWDDHLAIAEEGFRLGYDCISKEHYQPEAKRIEFVCRLVEAGHGDKIMLSGDIARRSYMTAYGGGPGFTYILWRFIPWLHREGLTKEQTDQLVVGNPAAFYAWTK